MEEIDNYTAGFIIIILLVGLSVAIYYAVTEYQNFIKCKNSENVLCPSFYCQNLIGQNGEEIAGTNAKCYDAKTNQGNKVPYRYVKGDTNNVMCQSYNNDTKNAVPATK